jgi:uncharacterized iron-regulated membrane protein
MSVNELHSWIGLLFGCLLFTVFLTGTLTVFDNEITDWMQQPEYVRLSSDARELDGASPSVTAVGRRTGYQSGDASIGRPPLLMVKLQKNRSFTGQTIDPDTGEMVTFRNTLGGDFFYHFHHGLLLGFPGAWIVGTAGMGMLVTLVTGVAIHRRGLKDVLVFWPRFSHQRAWLDAHNLTGIVVFPFHLMITFTGLMIFWSIYVPTDLQFLSGGDSTLSLLSDLHFAQFGSAALRWLYFLMGLAASMMIATGLVLWSNKRRKHHVERPGITRYRVVEVLNVATVAGLPVAIAAYFWANRILPLALVDRPLWETRCFFILWCCCLAHSLLRGGSIFAWRDQLYAAAVLFALLPLLNGLMTDGHLLMTVPKGEWAVAAFDLTVLAAGLLLGRAARRIGQVARREPLHARLSQ